jgi:hypothetical protein
MAEVCEFLNHESAIEDDIIIDYQKSYNNVWIIIEGSVNFEINIKNDNFQDKDVICYAREFGIDGRTLLN